MVRFPISSFSRFNLLMQYLPLFSWSLMYPRLLQLGLTFPVQQGVEHDTKTLCVLLGFRVTYDDCCLVSDLSTLEGSSETIYLGTLVCNNPALLIYFS